MTISSRDDDGCRVICTQAFLGQISTNLLNFHQPFLPTQGLKLSFVSPKKPFDYFGVLKGKIMSFEREGGHLKKQS